MNEGLDTGDMLLKSSTIINDDETSGDLHDRLSFIGADLILKTLNEISKGTIKRKKQNDDEASYSTMLDKSLCNIDWNKAAINIHNLVRGLNPWPTASTILNGNILKIHKTKVSNIKGGSPGEIISFLLGRYIFRNIRVAITRKKKNEF